MKVTEMLNKLAIYRSSGCVAIRTYSTDTKTTETNYLTSFEVEHFSEMDWPIAKAKLESFELQKGIDGRPELLINASI